MAYNRSLEVDWVDRACIGCFRYTNSSGIVINIPAREVAPAKRNVDDVQMKRFVRVVSVKFKLGPRKTLEDACVAVSAVHSSSSGFPDLSQDVPIVEDGNVE